MDRKATVYCKGVLAGRIEELHEGYRFAYDSRYLAGSEAQPISMTLPMRLKPFVSSTLFSFFYGLLAEGALKEMQCRKLRLDENDHFGRLLKTVGSDAIGAVTVVEEAEE